MVRLVEYPESSDDERDAADTRSDDGSQWSSVGEIPASPSDSFSYPMRSPESDEDEEDEDYAPSMTSLEAPGSVMSSVDTDDLDPDNDTDEERRETTEETEEEDEETNLDNFDNVDNFDREEEDEDVIDLTQKQEKEKKEETGDVFYAWKDLQAAFVDKRFKRRSVESRVEVTEVADDVEQHTVTQQEREEQQDLNRDQQQPGTATTAPNLFDVEAGRWSFRAAFAPGVAEKKKTRPHRRHTPTAAAQHRPTGVSPRFSTLSTGEQHTTTMRDTATAFPMQSSENSEKQDAKASPTAEAIKTTFFTTFQAPQVEIPGFSFGTKQTKAKTPDFTFGNAGATVFGEASDDTHMGSPSPRHTAATPFVPVDGSFTLGRSGKAPKPYNFTGNDGSGAVKFPSKAQSTAKIVDDGDDTHMRSPSPHAKPASRTPANSEFLFGQAYKNRKPYAFSRQNSNESFPSTGSIPIPISAASKEPVGTSWGTKVPVGGTSSGRLGANSESTAASAFFTTGVAGPNIHHRNSDRRKKKANSSSSFAPPSKSNSSASQFDASSSTFGSSLFQTATATRQRPDTSFAGDNVHENGVSSSSIASTVPSKKPSVTSTGGSFVFGSSKAKAFPEADLSAFHTGVFGSASSSAASATSNTGTPGQVLFGNGTSRNPCQFGEAETNSQTQGTNSQFPGQQTDNVSAPTVDGFQIGSLDAQKNSRVRPRRSGMFTNKNSPRKDAKVVANEPEPSPGFSSSSSTTTSASSMHPRRRRKNARLRQYGRSPPANPFATHTFQSHPSSSPFVSSDGELHPNVVRPMAKKGLGSAFGAPSASNTHFGGGTALQQDKTSEPGVFSFHPQRSKPSTLQPQNSNNSSGSQQNGSTQPAKSQQTSEGGTRPAYAGSRRILRAALRNVGVRGDRVSSASPTTGYHRDEGDAEMDSEDERDWLELKRLGGVAHCSRKYEEAAEYYRQSIEILESLLYRNTSMYTPEIRTDKAKLHANRAASLMMLMQITEAQRECRRSIEVDATYARAYLRLGRIQVLLGDTAHAQANIDTARQLMEGQRGEVSSGDQADHASLVKMETAIKKLTMLQGEIMWYIDCGDFKQAFVHTESALTLAPNSRKLQVQKARILLHQKELDQIIEFCTSIVEKQQASQEKLSSPASRSGRNTKSLKDKTVEKITFIGIDLGLLWATTLHYQNKIEDAVRILNALEVVAPCSSHVIQLKRQWQEMKQLKHSGNERFKRGEYQEAVRFYSEAVQIDPLHQEYCAIIYCNRSAAQMGLERYHTAVLDCNEALQRKPNYPRALLRRARCNVMLKIYHEAVKDFDRYLRDQPNNVPIETTAGVRRERNEAKAAIAKGQEEAKQREEAKKRAQRQQRQQRSHRWEDASWNDSRFYDNFRRGASSSNWSGYGSSRYQSSGAGGRASFMAPKTQRRTHYDVLGIEKTATKDQIKKSYRKLALVYHPDKAKTSTHADLFKEMTAAYNVLSDENARATYDRELIYNRFGNFYEN